MEQMIRDFLLEGGNISSLLLSFGIFLIVTVCAILYAICEKNKFYSARKETLNNLIGELNEVGLEIANTLLEIAVISANVEAALALGEVRKDIREKGRKSDFFQHLQKIIEVINDNNHTKILNSDYAKARNCIKEAIALIGEFSTVEDHKKLLDLAVRSSEIIKDIYKSSNNLNGILYGLKPHDEIEKEKITS